MSAMVDVVGDADEQVHLFFKALLNNVSKKLRVCFQSDININILRVYSPCGLGL